MAIPTRFDSFPLFSIDDDLSHRLEELGMEKNFRQLRNEGYTIIPDATTPEFAAEGGAVVKELAQETEGRAHGIAAPLLLGRHPVFDELMLNPKLLARQVDERIHGVGLDTFRRILRRQVEEQAQRSEWISLPPAS